jgi:hypothetical protein
MSSSGGRTGITAMFSHRIVTVDFYTTFPQKDLDPTYSDFRKCDATRVPVLRIFGATPQGTNKVLHFFFFLNLLISVIRGLFMM